MSKSSSFEVAMSCSVATTSLSLATCCLEDQIKPEFTSRKSNANLNNKTIQRCFKLSGCSYVKNALRSKLISHPRTLARETASASSLLVTVFSTDNLNRSRVFRSDNELSRQSGNLQWTYTVEFVVQLCC